MPYVLAWWADLAKTLKEPMVLVCLGVAFAMFLTVFVRVMNDRRRAREAAEERPVLPKIGSLGRPPAGSEEEETTGAPRHERRDAQRRAGNPTPVLFAGLDAKGGHLLGMVANRSVGGLCVVLDQEVPLKSVRRVRAVAASEDIPWVRVEVRHCRQLPDGWYIGCKFLETPPVTAMLLLG